MKLGENKGIKATESIRMTRACFYSFIFKAEAAALKSKPNELGFNMLPCFFRTPSKNILSFGNISTRRKLLSFQHRAALRKDAVRTSTGRRAIGKRTLIGS